MFYNHPLPLFIQRSGPVLFCWREMDLSDITTSSQGTHKWASGNWGRLQDEKEEGRTGVCPNTGGGRGFTVYGCAPKFGGAEGNAERGKKEIERVFVFNCNQGCCTSTKVHHYLPDRVPQPQALHNTYPLLKTRIEIKWRSERRDLVQK